MGGPAGTSISHCDAGTGGSTPRPSTRLGRRLGGDPLLLFLDELPPYLEYAVAVPVGSGDLGIVTTAALGKLFVGTGRSDLKVEPLHAPAVVFETADADPTPASSPVPTPARFEATALRYRLLAHDPADLTRLSPVNASTATVRLKQKLHNRDDRYELELLAMPKTNGLSIRYTTERLGAHHRGCYPLQRHLPGARRQPGGLCHLGGQCVQPQF